MKRNFFNLILLLLFLCILFFAYGLLNTSVSLKYETNNNCISQVTGSDLCFTLKIWEYGILIFIVAIIAMMALRNKIIKKHEEK